MNIPEHKWMHNPQYLAQVGHFFGAYSVTLTSFMLSSHWHYVLLAGIVNGLVKEFWYDLKFELPKQSLADSTMDFVFYFLGMCAALGVIVAFK